MKVLSLLVLFAVVGCSSHRKPASNAEGVAFDSMAGGNVRAQATKRADNQSVCFDINLAMKGVQEQDAHPSNWTVAWVNQNKQYHLMNMNQRDPASAPQGQQVIAPYGAYQEWSNNFTACTKEASMAQVQSLVLTPKDLPYKSEDGLKLNWQ